MVFIISLCFSVKPASKTQIETLLVLSCLLIEFINSIPKFSLFNNNEEDFFDKGSRATFLERLLTQIFMIFGKFGSEGAIFILIGKKK